MSKSVTRLGLIGAGAIAQVNHLPALAHMSDVEIHAICDDDLEKSRTLAQKYRIPHAFSDYEKLLRLQDLDAVIIATPNHLHAPMTLAALDYGKHVLCEKPPARTAAEAEMMAEAAKRSGKVLMYAMNKRFQIESQILRDLIDRRELGDVFYVKTGWLKYRTDRVGPEWYTNKRSAGGGVLMDLGVQMLDLSLWLLGNPKVVSVTATKFVRDPRQDVEETLAALILLDTGPSLMLEVSWALLLEKDFPYLNVYGTEGAALLHPFKIQKDMRGRLKDVTPPIEPSKNLYKQSYEAELTHFVRCITHGDRPQASPEEGLHVMRVIDAIYQSAEARREVRLH